MQCICMQCICVAVALSPRAHDGCCALCVCVCALRRHTGELSSEEFEGFLHADSLAQDMECASVNPLHTYPVHTIGAL